MKNITVQINSVNNTDGNFITSINGRSHFQIAVSDAAAAHLEKMRQTLPAKMDGSHIIDRNDLDAAISNGHAELEPVKQQIIERGREWLAQNRIAKTETASDDTLASAFFDDIDEGLYAPALSFEEFKEYKADTADEEMGEEMEEYIEDLYYNKYKESYLKWVMSHMADDSRFVADRIGTDLTDIVCGNLDNQLYYCITEG